ncbi:MAG: shikimate kinase [Chitinophagales bacterium]|nr:shikimate kinase [Chitinophagales bacterium]
MTEETQEDKPSLARIYLIGFMGSGKSFIGKKLANKLGYTWLDLDHEIERETAMKIHDIFQFWGEERFREIERDCLRKTYSRENIVVSCGGGTPCFYDNMEEMKAQGTVVYIQTPKEIILGRLRQKRDHRPMISKLDDDGLKAFIDIKIQEREKVYVEAGYIYQTDSEKLDDLLVAMQNKSNG